MKPTEQILVLLILVMSLSNFYFIYVYKLSLDHPLVNDTKVKVIYRECPIIE